MLLQTKICGCWLIKICGLNLQEREQLQTCCRHQIWWVSVDSADPLVIYEMLKHRLQLFIACFVTAWMLCVRRSGVPCVYYTSSISYKLVACWDSCFNSNSPSTTTSPTSTSTISSTISASTISASTHLLQHILWTFHQQHQQCVNGGCTTTSM